jgi:hypothetical protein
MAQRLFLIKKDKYRLDIVAFDDTEFEKIKNGESKHNYRLIIKEKFSEPNLEAFEANIIKNKIGFDLHSKLQFGTYLYTIEKINAAKESEEELVFGFIDILPDII